MLTNISNNKITTAITLPIITTKIIKTIFTIIHTFRTINRLFYSKLIIIATITTIIQDMLLILLRETCPTVAMRTKIIITNLNIISITKTIISITIITIMSNMQKIIYIVVL